MVQFSSKPPFNDDLFPYISSHVSRHAFPGTLGGERLVLDPRPQFERPQHNPTNPILTEFRKLHAETGNDLWTDAYLSWSDLIEQDWGERDEYWHAFSVLAKIVATGKVSR